MADLKGKVGVVTGGGTGIGRATALAMASLPPEYRQEPELALAGGDDGLDAVRTILKTAPRFLAPRGTLVVEIGHNRAAAELAFPRVPFVWLETASSADSVLAASSDGAPPPAWYPPSTRRA